MISFNTQIQSIIKVQQEIDQRRVELGIVEGIHPKENYQRVKFSFSTNKFKASSKENYAVYKQLKVFYTNIYREMV